MDLDSWMAQFSTAYRTFGLRLDDTTRNILLTSAPDAASRAPSRVVAQAKEVMTAFLFHKARNNETFGRVERIKEQFGKTLEENYGLSSGPFLSLARAYWTFRLELDDVKFVEPRPLLVKILIDVDLEVAGVFFPTPGVFKLPVATRRAAQRAILEKYAPGFDIDRFLEENPLLRRETGQQQSGCLGLMLILAMGCICAPHIVSAFRVCTRIGDAIWKRFWC